MMIKLLLVIVGMAILDHSLMAASHSLTWDADPSTAGAQDGAGSWIIGGNNWIDSNNPGTNVSWATLTGAAGAKEVDLVFGSSNGTAGNIIVTGTKGTTASGTDNMVYLRSVDNFIINNAGSGNYTFSGADLNLDGVKLVMNASGTTIINNRLSVANIAFNQAGTLVLNGGDGATISDSGYFGGFLWSGAITGTNATVARGSSVVLGGGNWGAINNAALNIGDTSTNTGGVVVNEGASMMFRGGMNIGNANGYMGLLVLNGGNVLSPAGMTSFYIGSGNNTNGKVLVNSGSLNVKGTDMTIANGGNSIGVLDVEGGSVLSGTLNTGNADKNIVVNSGAITGSALLSVSGSGTITTAGLIFGAGMTNATTYNFTTGTAAFNQTGGSVYIGSNGITLGANVNNLTPTITLSGGTIGATAAWSSTLKMTLNSGVTTFKAANADGSVNSNITLGGKLTGVGKLAKTGGGTLLLTAINDYQGGTIISAGILQTDTVGTLGSGNVFVDSLATLILGNSASIGNLSSLSFASGATIDLAFADTMSLASVFSGSTYLSAGTYSVSELNALFGSGFAGTGSITVIPEPSAGLLLVLGCAGLSVMIGLRYKRKKI